MKLRPAAATLLLAALAGCGNASVGNTRPPSTSPTATFTVPSASATRAEVVTAFLNAVIANHCAAARQLLLPPPAPQDGIPTYCIANRPIIDGWRHLANPGDASTMDIAAELHITRDDTGGPVPTWEIRFFVLTKTSAGWRISGGGTGP